MRKVYSTLLASACAAAVAAPALAQSTNTPDDAAAAVEANEEAQASGTSDIIVTARRRDESVLEVPQTVQAVTSRDIQEYNILNLKDVSELIPGLTLEKDNSGFGATAQVRGVNFQVTAQGSPTVEQYLNEVPIEPNTAFQANFDVGQIEVLRGPQGTLRGRSAPSGAMTITTRRPDLEEFGGYASTTLSDRGDVNVQGAVNVPIIKDVLGVRLAGIYDRNDAGGVRSVVNPRKPSERTIGFRATVRFEPTSNLSAVVMYQRMDRDIYSYGSTAFGSGVGAFSRAPGFAATDPAGALQDNSAVAGIQACPAGSTVGLNTCLSLAGGLPGVEAPALFNGPVILQGDTIDNRRALADFPNYTNNLSHIVTGQIDWRVGGQKLSYVGGYIEAHSLNLVDGDATNTIVGVRRIPGRNSCCGQKRQSHELRLSSEERLFGMLDYTVGGFYMKITNIGVGTISEQNNTFALAGAFGSPLGPNAPTGPGILRPTTYDPRYILGFAIVAPGQESEKGLFGNLMLHLGENTELSAGVRQIWKMKEGSVAAEPIRPGIAAIRNPNATAGSPFAACPTTLSGPTGAGTIINGTVVGQTYAGTCDVQVSLGNGAPLASQLVRSIPFGRRTFNPLVYNFSLSHKFTPDLLVYANYGTSWRQGPGPVIAAPNCAASATVAGGVVQPLNTNPNYCDAFNILESETSKGVEIGAKAAFFDRRLNVSVALYRQTFKNFFIRGDTSVPFLQGVCSDAQIDNANSQLCTLTNGTFTYNADAVVKGIDLEANMRFSDNFNMSALFSYSKGSFTNSLIPCRDSNFDGKPDALPLPSAAGVSPQRAWLNAGGPFGPALCANSGSSSTAPPWNFTLRGEYSRDVLPGARGFIRGLLNYYPENTNRPTAISVDANGTTPASQRGPGAYALVNLFVGLRGDRGQWEASVGVRNLFNNRNITSRSTDPASLVTPQSGLAFSSLSTQNSGYRTIDYLDPREFQFTLRYAFGSR